MKILVVEDDPSVIKDIQDALIAADFTRTRSDTLKSNCKNVNVRLISDPEKAEQVLSEEICDVLFIDWELYKSNKYYHPVLYDGAELAVEALKNGVCHQVVCITSEKPGDMQIEIMKSLGPLSSADTKLYEKRIDEVPATDTGKNIPGIIAYILDVAGKPEPQRQDANFQDTLVKGLCAG
jgi:CheY-like chemotaxis protein